MEMHINFYITIAILLLVWNLIVLAVYKVDKRKAIKGKWRIPEATLIGIAFVFGGFGALIGMHRLRHKTKKIKFRLLIPLAVIFNIVLLFGFVYLLET